MFQYLNTLDATDGKKTPSLKPKGPYVPRPKAVCPCMPIITGARMRNITKELEPCMDIAGLPENLHLHESSHTGRPTFGLIVAPYRSLKL